MSAMRAIMGGIVDLLQGKTGATECRIPTQRFRHSNVGVRSLGPNAASRAPRPFSFESLALLDSGEAQGDLTSGTGMRGQHRLVLEIAYGDMPQQRREILSDIADDETDIRRVLEYEPNIALTSEWTGCRVASTSIDLAGDDDVQSMRILVVELEIDHHETRIT